jgi:hypothetical protein
MHGLAEDIDLCFLNGLEVIQIAIGSYQIIFTFDENVRISVYSRPVAALNCPVVQSDPKCTA